MVLIVVLSSFLFIAHEAAHVCKGEKCHICSCLEKCEKTLQQIGCGIAVLMAEIVPIVILLAAASLSVFLLQRATPVSSKVRLDN